MDVILGLNLGGHNRYGGRMGCRLTTLDFHLRLGREGDSGSVALMSRDVIEAGLGWSWRPERVVRQIRDPHTCVLVAERGSHFAGFAIMQYLEVHAHLNLLAVGPSFRNLGLGRRLVSWLENSALVAGIWHILLEVRRTNRGARAFYRRLGYREHQVLSGYYQGREDAVRMVHQIGNRPQLRRAVIEVDALMLRVAGPSA